MVWRAAAGKAEYAADRLRAADGREERSEGEILVGWNHTRYERDE